ncbi:MAG: transcriptional repressor [Hyphomicrobiales bacterium]
MNQPESVTSRSDQTDALREILRRAERKCVRSGVRLTQLRREILSIIASGQKAVGAYDIIEHMGALNGRRPAPIVIYRILDFLREHELIHRLEGKKAFVACKQDHCHGRDTMFMICDECSSVTEFPAPDVLTSLRRATGNRGFRTRHRVVEIYGRCRSCRETSSHSTPPSVAPSSVTPC